MKKKAKFFEKVEKIETAIVNYCDENGFSYQRNGEYSIFINLTNSMTSLKSDIKEYIANVVEMSKKKLKKLITLLTVNNRIYILFKANLSCY